MVNQSLYPKLPFDPAAFVPVTVLADQPNVLVARPTLPVSNAKELIAYAKDNPGKLSFASSGIGTVQHLGMEQLKAMTGIEVVHVPYRGLAPALNDLVAGHVDLMLDNLGTSAPHIKNGSLKGIAIGSERRNPLLPDMPAMSETVPGFVSTTWFAMVAPPKTPAAIADQLFAAVSEVLKLPEVRERLRDLYADANRRVLRPKLPHSSRGKERAGIKSSKLRGSNRMMAGSLRSSDRVLAAPIRSPRPFRSRLSAADRLDSMLALFLDRYGVRSVLFNTDDGSRQHPKGQHAERSHLGAFPIVLEFPNRVRKLGLPADHPTDVAYFTRFNAWELARVRMPSESHKMRAVAAASATDQVPEPLLRANQMYVEAFLLEYARTRPNIVLRFGWEVDWLEADADEVTLQAEAVTGGRRECWRAQYLVGCDGARSFVRRTLGAAYHGFDALQQAYMGGRMIASHIRAPTLLRACFGERRGWQYWSINPERQMMLGSLNGNDEFLVFAQQAEPHHVPDDSMIAKMIFRAAGAELPVQILGHRPWTAGVALVSETIWAGPRTARGRCRPSVHAYRRLWNEYRR